MCWMTIRRNGPSSLRRALMDAKGAELRSGGHSWGWAAIIDGDLTIGKGVGRIDWHEMMDAPDVDGVAIAHTRFATRGSITAENAHPYAITNAHGETVAALAHNGTWINAPMDEADGDHTDSWYIARELESLYRNWATVGRDPDADFAELVEDVGAYVGETFIVLHRDGRAFTHSGRYEITHGDDGTAVWSSGGEVIPTGTVYQMDSPRAISNRKLDEYAGDADADADADSAC